MIRHIVMWKFKDQAEGLSREENAKKVKAMLEALNGVIGEIIHLEVGINVIPSGMAFDAVLVSEFANEENLEKYKVHPEHVKVADYIAKIRDGRAVVDYQT